MLFLDELLNSLSARQPDSPLVAALTPLHTPLPELAQEIRNLYPRVHGQVVAKQVQKVAP